MLFRSNLFPSFSTLRRPVVVVFVDSFPPPPVEICHMWIFSFLPYNQAFFTPNHGFFAQIKQILEVRSSLTVKASRKQRDFTSFRAAERENNKNFLKIAAFRWKFADFSRSAFFFSPLYHMFQLKHKYFLPPCYNKSRKSKRHKLLEKSYSK